ncbi:MAG TPA: VTT domain-containing protein [Bryobacteraceae bacterium]|nr:VTT domain-containing protein [Bryobacteraceae bacterium]
MIAVMDSLLPEIARYGVPLLAGVVFLEAVGLPLPASLALLVAGASAAHGSLRPAVALPAALAAMLCADNLLYFAGRYTGWWLLRILCRLSLNPESCILRAAGSFYRRGRFLLLFAKFVPGINSLAPPLAGSMKMPYSQFLWLDLLGASLYVGLYWTAGFLLSDLLGVILKGLDTFSRVLAILVAIAVIAYFAYQARLWIKNRALRTIPRVSPAEAARILEAGGAMVYDVRSHGYYEHGAARIPGSQRLEPNSLDRPTDLSKTTPLILYCTCVREATSLPVANILRQQGLQCSVLAGGLRAWKKAGLPLEPVPPEEIVALPSFAILKR